MELTELLCVRLRCSTHRRINHFSLPNILGDGNRYNAHMTRTRVLCHEAPAVLGRPRLTGDSIMLEMRLDCYHRRVR